jgi:drug/metabolite transporter (DMT)-like permease
LKQFTVSALYGFLNPFAYYLVLFAAYDLLPAQQAQIINYTWAITLTVLSIPLLKQKVSGLQWIAILVSYSGVLVIATKGDLFSLNLENPLGVGLALLSTIIWALYWIFNTRDDRDPVIGLFLNFLFALPYSFIYILCTEGLRELPIQGYLGALYIGVFEMGVAFVLWLTAMKLTESTAKIANLIFIAPFISLFFIHHLVGEAIYVSTVVGLGFVMAGLLIQGLTKTE